MRRLACRLFGHRLYVDPRPTEICPCSRCGSVFMWVGHTWRPMPATITYQRGRTC